MDVALSLSSPESHSHFSRRCSVTRSDSHSSTASSHRRGEPMAIPGARRPSSDVPPPLPPPRHITALEEGEDLGYRFGQTERSKHGPLRPLMSGSSLLGEGFPRPPTREHKMSMDLDRNEHSDRKIDVSTTQMRSPRQTDTGARHSNVVRRPPSPGSILHGEKPLARENLNRSNQAYDQSVLSKIGKSNSPPRHTSESAESPVLTQTLSVQTKDVKPAPQQSTPTEKSGTIAESGSRWPTSPASTVGASPFSRSNPYYISDPRSPGTDTAPNPMALDPELFVPRSAPHHQQQQPSQQNSLPPLPASTIASIASSTLLVTEDARNRSARSSYDQAMYTPASETTDVAFDDQPAVNRPPKQGLKRKSPPCDGQHEERPRPDLYPKLATLASRSPTTHYAHLQGSLSSTASSLQRASYASSMPLSVAQSSMTSVSSFETPSPRDFITSAHPTSSPVALIAPRKGQEKMEPRKLSVQHAQDARPAPARIGNHYICGCCPKKPKKFETEEQLRTHENEKQYSCSFCSNRFKNKNEAERHQNSLHLRRHSWSCAALANYEAAFSPAGAVDSNSTTMDACGYCGEEFPNHPAPDWDRRIDHLTNVHKFGECNSGKKFFRADHFRQHLKHSHAGRSGKWTNILEHACVRDEIPPEPVGFQMNAGDSTGIPVRSTSMLSAPLNVPTTNAIGRNVADK